MNHESFPRTLQQLLLSWSQRMKKWRSPSKHSNSSRRPVLGAKGPTPIRFLDQQLYTACENRMLFQSQTGPLAFLFVDFLELLIYTDFFVADFLDERERSTDWRRASLRSKSSPLLSSPSS